MKLFVVPVLLALGCFGQAPVPQPGPGALPLPNAQAQTEKPKADCVIKGRILNGVTGEPLRKATVNLQKQGARNAGREKEVGPDGKFEFSAVEPGRYSLTASRTGFVRTPYGAKKPGGPGVQITLAPGQEMKDLVIQLPPHAVILGRVIDEDGEPMANVNVSAARWMWQGRRRELTPMGQATTNDLGEYRIFGVAPGSYVVQAVRQQSFGMQFEPEPPSPKPEESYITTYYPGVTDSSSASRVAVRAGTELRSIDIRMAKSRVVRVQGKVLNASGKPASNAMVSLAPRNRGWGAWAETRRAFIQDPTQGFDIRNVPPGQYVLTAELAMGMGAEGRQSASLPVDVADHNIDDLVVRLSPGVDVSGTLKVEGGSLDGPSTQVYLESTEGEGPAYMGGGGGPVKEDGTFTVRGVQPGHYRIHVYRPDSYLKAARAGDQDVLENPLDIGPEAPPALELLISAKGAEVSGTVKDADGKALTGVQVILFPEEKRRAEWAAYGFGTTDQYGAFKIKGLRPGAYKALAFDDFEMGDQMDPEFLKPVESKAKTLDLREAATETIDLTVVPSETVAAEKAKRGG